MQDHIARFARSTAKLGLLALLVLLVTASWPGLQRQHTAQLQSTAYATAPLAQSNSVSATPTEFTGLYATLNNSLQGFDKVNTHVWRNTGDYHTDFGGDLIYANSQTLKLSAATYQHYYQQTLNYLSGLQAVGIRTVKVDIAYPALATNFPNYAVNMQYYSSLGAEIHRRHMKFLVNSFVFIPHFSSIPFKLTGMSLATYAASKLVMLQAIVDKVQPDYLTIEDEPYNEASITQIAALMDPSNYPTLLNIELNGLHRGHTLIGAGCGTWENMGYATAVVGVAGLDYIDYHVYPLSTNYLQQLVPMIDAAKAHHKLVFIGEFWPDKVPLTRDPQAGGTLNDRIARNSYSFWQPFDESFVKIMAKLAIYKQVDFISAFWTRYFFAYIPYTSSLAGMGSAYVIHAENLLVDRNAQAKSLTDIGKLYKDIISDKEEFVGEK